MSRGLLGRDTNKLLFVWCYVLTRIQRPAGADRLTTTIAFIVTLLCAKGAGGERDREGGLDVCLVGIFVRPQRQVVAKIYEYGCVWRGVELAIAHHAAQQTGTTDNLSHFKIILLGFRLWRFGFRVRQCGFSSERQGEKSVFRCIIPFNLWDTLKSPSLSAPRSRKTTGGTNRTRVVLVVFTIYMNIFLSTWDVSDCVEIKKSEGQ